MELEHQIKEIEDSKFKIGDRIRSPAGFTGTVINYWLDKDGWFCNIEMDHLRRLTRRIITYRQNDLALLSDSVIEDIQT